MSVSLPRDIGLQMGEGEDLTTSITAFTKAIAIKSFEPTFGKSSAMDEPAACKLKLKGKKRGFKPHTKRKIPNKYKEDRGKSMKVRFLTDSGSTSNPIEGLLGSDKVALLRNQCFKCQSQALQRQHSKQP